MFIQLLALSAAIHLILRATRSQANIAQKNTLLIDDGDFTHGEVDTSLVMEFKVPDFHGHYQTEAFQVFNAHAPYSGLINDPEQAEKDYQSLVTQQLTQEKQINLYQNLILFKQDVIKGKVDKNAITGDLLLIVELMESAFDPQISSTLPIEYDQNAYYKFINTQRSDYSPYLISFYKSINNREQNKQDPTDWEHKIYFSNRPYLKKIMAGQSLISQGNKILRYLLTRTAKESYFLDQHSFDQIYNKYRTQQNKIAMNAIKIEYGKSILSWEYILYIMGRAYTQLHKEHKQLPTLKNSLIETIKKFKNKPFVKGSENYKMDGIGYEVITQWLTDQAKLLFKETYMGQTFNIPKAESGNEIILYENMIKTSSYGIFEEQYIGFYELGIYLKENKKEYFTTKEIAQLEYQKLLLTKEMTEKYQVFKEKKLILEIKQDDFNQEMRRQAVSSHEILKNLSERSPVETKTLMIRYLLNEFKKKSNDAEFIKELESSILAERISDEELAYLDIYFIAKKLMQDDMDLPHATLFKFEVIENMRLPNNKVIQTEIYAYSPSALTNEYEIFKSTLLEHLKNDLWYQAYDWINALQRWKVNFYPALLVLFVATFYLNRLNQNRGRNQSSKISIHVQPVRPTINLETIEQGKETELEFDVKIITRASEQAKPHKDSARTEQKKEPETEPVEKITTIQDLWELFENSLGIYPGTNEQRKLALIALRKSEIKGDGENEEKLEALWLAQERELKHDKFIKKYAELLWEDFETALDKTKTAGHVDVFNKVLIKIKNIYLEKQQNLSWLTKPLLLQQDDFNNEYLVQLNYEFKSVLNLYLPKSKEDKKAFNKTLGLFANSNLDWYLLPMSKKIDEFIIAYLKQLEIPVYNDTMKNNIESYKELCRLKDEYRKREALALPAPSFEAKPEKKEQDHKEPENNNNNLEKHTAFIGLQTNEQIKNLEQSAQSQDHIPEAPKVPSNTNNATEKLLLIKNEGYQAFADIIYYHVNNAMVDEHIKMRAYKMFIIMYHSLLDTSEYKFEKSILDDIRHALVHDWDELTNKFKGNLLLNLEVTLFNITLHNNNGLFKVMKSLADVASEMDDGYFQMNRGLINKHIDNISAISKLTSLLMAYQEAQNHQNSNALNMYMEQLAVMDILASMGEVFQNSNLKNLPGFENINDQTFRLCRNITYHNKDANALLLWNVQQQIPELINAVNSNKNIAAPQPQKIMSRVN